MTATVYEIKKGLNVPLAGGPDQMISEGPEITRVALIGDDYLGMKPTMKVQVGDDVRLGQVLFEDKKRPGVFFTAPAGGRVAEINRGPKRRFESLVIDVDDQGETEFETFADQSLDQLPRDKVVGLLQQSGLWTSLRTRPYSKTPNLSDQPSAIFVTAIDTNPLAVDPAIVLKLPEYDRWFVHGLRAISALTEGRVYVCKATSAGIPVEETERIKVAEFSGPHPAGLVGTHIHILCPASEQRTVWHIGYQDVVAIGRVFLEGRMLSERIVSVAGPAAQKPRIVRTRSGASLDQLTAGNRTDGELRIISGSALSGRAGRPPIDFLGRFHNQVTLLRDEVKREFLGWAMPGFRKYSITRAFASNFFKDDTRSAIDFTTSKEGSHRAIVPIGTYEKVVPLDIVVTALLKSLLVQDAETAQMLGCLELDEEDLALCSFVCPGKNDYGPLLRHCLDHIEREG